MHGIASLSAPPGQTSFAAAYPNSHDDQSHLSSRAQPMLTIARLCHLYVCKAYMHDRTPASSGIDSAGITDGVKPQTLMPAMIVTKLRGFTIWVPRQTTRL